MRVAYRLLNSTPNYVKRRRRAVNLYCALKTCMLYKFNTWRGFSRMLVWRACRKDPCPSFPCRWSYTIIICVLCLCLETTAASAGTRVVGAEAPGGLGQEPAPLGLFPDLSAAQLDDLGSPPDVDLLLPGAEPSPVADGMSHAATRQPRDAVELGNDLFVRFRGLSPSLIRRQLLGDVPDPDDVTLFWLTVIAQF